MKPHRLRLQGGPFDGARHELGIRKEALVEPPARVWITRCGICGSHIYRAREPGGELYRRDVQDGKGLWVYVFTDYAPSRTPAKEREKVSA